MTRPLDVLLIDDDPTHSERLCEMVSNTSDRNLVVTPVPSLTGARDWLNDSHADVLLVDLDLPESGGVRTLESLRKMAHDVPVVVLTRSPEELAELESARSGAEDFVVKSDVDGTTLERTLRNAIARQHAARRVVRILEANADGIIVLNDHRHVLYANPAAGTMWGRDARDLLGSTVELPIPESGVAECGIVRADGSSVAVEVRSNPIDWEGSEATMASLRDVTERRRAEQKLREHERHSLRVRRLEALGLLAGGIAHDFNNFLAVIRGHCELALERVDTQSPLAPNLRAIDETSKRAGALTKQLLDMSGRKRQKTQATDASATIHGMEAIVSTVTGDAVSAVYDLAENLPAIDLDRSQAEQIVLNLTMNARDAMPEGGQLTIGTRCGPLPELLRKAHPDLAGGTYVALFVIDEGCGMGDATQDRIFEPFFTTKEFGHGSGLGLAMVYNTAKKNAGFVDCESEPGYGTKMTVYLPASADAAPDRREDGIGGHAGGVDGSGTTILVADDEREIREVLRDALEMDGYRVLVAADGREALSLLEARGAEIDVVLTDIAMPGADGRKVAARAIQRVPGIRVILMSGNPGRISSDDGELLQKPFSLMQLRRRVHEEVLRARRAPSL